MANIVDETTSILNITSTERTSKIATLYNITQLGVSIVVFQSLYLVWKDGYAFFNWHPTLALLFFYFSTQGILALHYAKTQPARGRGLKLHQIFQLLSVICFTGAFYIIRAEMLPYGGPNYSTTHGRIGLIVFIITLIGATVGLTSVHFPRLYGSALEARKVIPSHRLTGYVIYILTALNVYFGLELTLNLHTTIISYWVYPSLILAVGSVLAMVDTNKLRGFSYYPTTYGGSLTALNRYLANRC